MNNLNELYNLVNFMNPGFLGGRKQFKEEYGKNISNARLKNALRQEKVLGRILKKNLIEAIEPIFLRHTKQ